MKNLKNNYLSSEISMLDKKISEIRGLDRKKENLQQRMRFIEELQSSRNLGTQIMDEVAKIVPSGVYFTTLERRGDAIQVTGNPPRSIQTGPRYSSFILKPHCFSQIQIMPPPTFD